MKSAKTNNQLSVLQEERLHIADVLQNDLNQMLASVLLCMQFKKTENQLAENTLFSQAEMNLKIVIGKISNLHYSLSQELN
jgi:hypothetical protein